MIDKLSITRKLDNNTPRIFMCDYRGKVSKRFTVEPTISGVRKIIWDRKNNQGMNIACKGIVL